MSTQLDENELRELMENRERIDPANIEYYLTNEEDLREDYGGHVIAIADEKVVNDIEDTSELEPIRSFIDRIRSEYDNAYITRVPEPDQVMML